MSSHTVLTEHQSHRSFGGYQKVYSHESKELGCTMKFGVYLPPQVEERKLPVIYFLSGLSATEQNFIIKSGAQRYAAEYGVILVNPDTSPRGDHIPDDPDSMDFGIGAGFFVNATQEPWKKHFKIPIANPSKGPWGIKAFTGYFGPKSEEWNNWDATELVKKYNGPPFEVLIDQASQVIGIQ
ncbi:hypothetical protein NQ314_002222 [Rhamnusium bicolor]|uniref:S-formylglutathione hydrolase n=1 Tax=Rhamnusium bicolor TaxID=1586634 RepID=A0AAV8ZRT8_9CUCU|nr:hypothetical protein NQ314_002222 [Rhamnusium bicolor]